MNCLQRPLMYGANLTLECNRLGFIQSQIYEKEYEFYTRVPPLTGKLVRVSGAVPAICRLRSPPVL